MSPPPASTSRLLAGYLLSMPKVVKQRRSAVYRLKAAVGQTRACSVLLRSVCRASPLCRTWWRCLPPKSSLCVVSRYVAVASLTAMLLDHRATTVTATLQDHSTTTMHAATVTVAACGSCRQCLYLAAHTPLPVFRSHHCLCTLSLSVCSQQIGWSSTPVSSWS